MNKMIYIRKADEPFWERLEQIASDQGQELSPYLSALVRNHVYSVTAGGETPQTIREMAEIVASKAEELASALATRTEES